MSIKPILFKGPMVRAILEGRKTQTRRIIKPQPPTREDWLRTYPDELIPYNMEVERDVSGQWWWNNEDLLGPLEIPCAIDDLLYVRESWTTGVHCDDIKPSEIPTTQSIGYLADVQDSPWLGKSRPSIFMPRWASRITLKVTEVRVQRLQDTSEQDAQAKGIERRGSLGFGPEFICLWDSINDGLYAWAKNPWVVAYTFEPIFQNVDQIGGQA